MKNFIRGALATILTLTSTSIFAEISNSNLTSFQQKLESNESNTSVAEKKRDENKYLEPTRKAQVEIIIFQHIDPYSSLPEHWPSQLIKPHLPDDSINLIPNISEVFNKTLPLYNISPKESWNLNQEQSTLEKLPEYKVILHMAWIQPLVNKENSRYVHILGGQAFDNNGNEIRITQEDILWDPEDKYWAVDGSIRVSEGRYLQMDMNIYITQPIDSIPEYIKSQMNPVGALNLLSFKVQQNRKIHLNQLNYFDHPVFGVLLSVKKI